MIGPRIGPIMIPMPQIAIICDWREGLLISSMADWLSGAMNAPEAPCNARNSTISVMFCAIPHNIEATMNPAVERMNRRRDPTRSANQPVIGIATALATI